MDARVITRGFFLHSSLSLTFQRCGSVTFLNIAFRCDVKGMAVAAVEMMDLAGFAAHSPCLFLQWPYPITTKSILVLDFFVSPCAFHRAIDGLKGETGIKVKRGRRKKVRPWEGNCLDHGHVARKSRILIPRRIYSDGQCRLVKI